jgi:hypothetical protein
MLQNAKFAYLLSSCHELTDEVMKLMIDQHVDSKTVSTRHYFNLFINLKEPESTGQFAIKDLYCKFANSDDAIILEALQYHNNTLISQNEMSTIHKNLVNSDIILTYYQLVSIFSIATLIKMYNGISKYLFIPIIIDYGRNKKLVHQTALIIDMSQNQLKFIYYEPYGLYEKYGKSYEKCIGQLFNCFNNFNGNSITYITYHDMFDMSDMGIQKIILDTNNSNVDVFNIEMTSLIELFNIDFLNVLNINIQPSIDYLSDKTQCIIDILHTIDTFDINKLSNDQKNKYFKHLNTALKLYYRFNSKNCVSITVIELDTFFKVSAECDNDFNLIKTKMIEYNLSHRISCPNTMIMTNIYKIVDLFTLSVNIKEILKSDQQLRYQCKKILHI